ncbi:MAG: hypothetical protein A4E58_01652 [Syntrophorhabdus sp. PtaB.Bin006]|nr:MAG: hypothetical protein A4E58_01652 [Syntrophorhabdus sp. PtaB.Bin006]
MRVLFTKYQEEVTTVKKSVTEVKVETGGADFKAAEFPVIEVGPGVLNVEGPSPAKPAQARLDRRREPPTALGNRAEQVRDIVDLRGPSKNEDFGSIGYSVRGAARGNPYQQPYTREEFSQSGDESALKQNRAESGRETDSPSPVNEERLSRYIQAARISISTQAMSQYHSRKEKKLTINIEV